MDQLMDGLHQCQARQGSRESWYCQHHLYSLLSASFLGCLVKRMALHVRIYCCGFILFLCIWEVFKPGRQNFLMFHLNKYNYSKHYKKGGAVSSTVPSACFGKSLEFKIITTVFKICGLINWWALKNQTKGVSIVNWIIQLNSTVL